MPMMCNPSAPAWERIAIFLLGPPILTVIWAIKARGWALFVQGGAISDRTKKRQRWEFWALLAALYAMMLGVAVYAYFKCG
jgi:uncharacterized membrane protein HdeD (DUF308 family)